MSGDDIDIVEQARVAAAELVAAARLAHLNVIEEVIVTDSGGCLRRQADCVDEWWWFHADGDEYERVFFDSAADVRRFLVASLAALDEWEARRG